MGWEPIGRSSVWSTGHRTLGMQGWPELPLPANGKKLSGNSLGDKTITNQTESFWEPSSENLLDLSL